MDSLNELETEILDRLSRKYPKLKQHLPYIKVRDRKLTGVGMYVNFCYIQPSKNLLSLEIFNGSMSTNENIEIEGLEYGLGYEVDITEGMINFIEFFTYGEEWNGKLAGYSFI